MEMNTNKGKRKNIGIAVLRIWMCFEVVLCHFYSWNPSGLITSFLKLFSLLAVPVFVVLAFMFTDTFLLAQNSGQTVKRLQRLIVPHFLWALTYYLAFWVLDAFSGYSMGIHHGIKGFLGVLLTGNILNTAAWFQVDLIILTIVFVLLAKLSTGSPKRYRAMLLMMAIFALFLQYSQVWFTFVNRHLCNTVFFWPIGRFMEVIPLAVAGDLLNYLKIPERVEAISSKKHSLLIVSLVVGVLVAFFADSFYLIENDFMYSGFGKVIEASLLVLLFYELKSCRIVPKYINSALMELRRVALIFSSCTGNVYFSHILVGTIVLKTGFSQVLNVQAGTMKASVMIFVISMLVALMLRAFNNRKGQHVWLASKLGMQ